jgi:hypothetical protein
MEKIGIKVETGDSKSEAYEEGIVIYWTDNDHMTWYDMNLVNFAAQVAFVYGDNPLGKSRLLTYLARLNSVISLANSTVLDLGINEQPSFTFSSESTSESTSESNEVSTELRSDLPTAVDSQNGSEAERTNDAGDSGPSEKERACRRHCCTE